MKTETETSLDAQLAARIARLKELLTEAAAAEARPIAEARPELNAATVPE